MQGAARSASCSCIGPDKACLIELQAQPVGPLPRLILGLDMVIRPRVAPANAMPMLALFVVGLAGAVRPTTNSAVGACAVGPQLIFCDHSP
jgi:hypothetical protein